MIHIWCIPRYLGNAKWICSTLVCEIRFIAPRPDKKNKGETIRGDSLNL